MINKYLSFLIYAAGVGGTVIFSLLTIDSYRIATHDYVEQFRKYPWKSWEHFFVGTIIYIVLAILCFVAVIIYNRWRCKTR